MVPSNFLTLECPFPSLVRYALESHWDFPPLMYIKLCILKDFHSFCLQPRTLNIPLTLSGPSRVQFSIIQYIVQHSLVQYNIVYYIVQYIVQYSIAYSIVQYSGGLVPNSCLTLSTPWIIALQALLSMGFSRQEHWSGLPFLLQGKFWTQESNLGLLHCRKILYLLRQQRNPYYSIV